MLPYMLDYHSRLTWSVKLWDDTDAASLGISDDLLHLQPQDPGAQQRLLCPWRIRGTVCLPHQGEASFISTLQPAKNCLPASAYRRASLVLLLLQ